LSAWFGGQLTTAPIEQPHHFSGPVGLLFGGRMLFTIALVLLAGWSLGVLGAYSAGSLKHVLLLIGLFFLLLAFSKARDATLRRPPDSPTDRA
jgi:hypothetical protein